jgi:hypothetical protein
MKYKIVPRALTEKEWANREKGIYDSFATYLVFCENCGKVERYGMYIMSAEACVERYKRDNKTCPVCRQKAWTVGYPAESKTGFAKVEYL